jgi:hypothetical protein
MCLIVYFAFVQYRLLHTIYDTPDGSGGAAE